jgi:ABC-type sulfate/molybdate transport systems ATPase subunit
MLHESRVDQSRSEDFLTRVAETRRDAQPGEDFVVFDHVQKSYDGVSLVVKDLNLRIEEGEFLTMRGPSGSGKTTCLMMLAGFETATGGQIRLAGRNINLVPRHKRAIGMVFQNYALFPHMTIAENLAFPLEVRGLAKAEREAKIKCALEMVQMEAFSNRRPAQLSGGQQQRVALARALVFKPSLVLMDEPLGALDKQLREHMQFEIERLHEALGITVVYVTHDQGEALTMSDRVAVFNNGRIQQLGSPADIYERPETYTGVILAHATLGIPFVIITVTATLVGFDRSLSRAAASLGASPTRTFFKVILPLILPGVVSGALFAFATSFDEVVTVLFVGGPQQQTIPRQMWSGIREQISPAILAAATILVLISIALLATVELLRRRSERLRGIAPR